MSLETKRYIAQAVIQHLNGDMELFRHYVRQALEIREREAHLYVSVADRIKAKGETA